MLAAGRVHEGSQEDQDGCAVLPTMVDCAVLPTTPFILLPTICVQYNPMSDTRGIRDIVAKIGLAAKLDAPLSPHDLRHTFARSSTLRRMVSSGLHCR